MSRLLKKLHGKDMLAAMRGSDSEGSDTVEPSLMMATSQSRKNQKKKQKKARVACEAEGAEEAEEVPKAATVQPPRQAKKKKKKKQKEPEVQKESSESEDIDAILNAHKAKANQNKSEKEIEVEKHSNSELAKLFVCGGEALDPEEELKKMFGAAAIAQERRDAGEGNRRRANRMGQREGRGAPKKATRFRETLLAKPDADTWPRFQNHGYTMSSKEGRVRQWNLEESGECLIASRSLQQAVNSMQLEAFDALLYRYPYYIPALLKYNGIVCQMGEFSEGAAMIDQALYTVSMSTPPDFSWVAPFTEREMPFEGTNKDIFFTIMVKVQSMLKRGCHRTALEWCKMLFNLNKKDPCHALLLFDYCAVKSGMWQWFMDLQKAMLAHDTWFEHTAKLPGFKYGVALCAKLRGDEKANSLLTDAVRWYPHAVPQILTDVKATGETGAAELMTTDLPEQLPAVESLVRLYVARSGELWGGPTAKWLVEIALKVKKASEDGSLVPVAELPTIARSDVFAFHSQCDAASHMGRVEVLPQEAFEDDAPGAGIDPDMEELMQHMQEGAMGMDDEAFGGFGEADIESEALQMLAIAESEIITLQDAAAAYLEAPTDSEKARINELSTRQLLFLDGIVPEDHERDEVRSRRKSLIDICHQICDKLENPQ